MDPTVFEKMRIADLRFADLLKVQKTVQIRCQSSESKPDEMKSDSVGVQEAPQHTAAALIIGSWGGPY